MVDDDPPADDRELVTERSPQGHKATKKRMRLHAINPQSAICVMALRRRAAVPIPWAEAPLGRRFGQKLAVGSGLSGDVGNAQGLKRLRLRLPIFASPVLPKTHLVKDEGGRMKGTLMDIHPSSFIIQP